jgi:hypothetical protein
MQVEEFKNAGLHLACNILIKSKNTTAAALQKPLL